MGYPIGLWGQTFKKIGLKKQRSSIAVWPQGLAPGYRLYQCVIRCLKAQLLFPWNSLAEETSYTCKTRTTESGAFSPMVLVIQPQVSTLTLGSSAVSTFTLGSSTFDISMGQRCGKQGEYWQRDSTLVFITKGQAVAPAESGDARVVAIA